MPLKLAVTSRDTSGITTVAAYGEATASDFPTTNHLLFDGILGAQWSAQRVVLDFDAVPSIDSSAIGWLINVQKAFREGGGSLVLHSVQPHVHNILKLLKIERVIPIAKDAAEAAKLVQKKPTRAKRSTQNA